MNKKFLAYFFTLGAVLGVCPRMEQRKRRTKVNKNLHPKIYVPLIIIAFLGQFARFIWFKVKQYYLDGRFITLLLGILVVSVLTMDITLTILFMNFTQKKKWNSMNKYLNFVENQLAFLLRRTDTGILGHVYIDIIFITVILSFTNTSFFWIFPGYPKFFAYLQIARFYYLYMIVLVYLIVTRIRNGLKQLHAFLERLIPSKFEEVEANIKLIQPYNSFSEFLKCYRIIYDVVQFFNDIFGFHMVFLNLHCILEWLTILNTIISAIKLNAIEINIFIWLFLNITINLIVIIFIILLCSSVTSEAEHFLYVLHQIEENNRNLKAKSIVLQLVEDMPLHFSAARFFNISKYTILGLIGNCTTYFIVLIQFYQ